MNSDQAEVLSRFAKLERENKRLRIAGMVLLLFVIVVVAGAAKIQPHTLSANEFVLQDEQGRARAQLSVDSKRVSLVFFDELGRSQMTLAALDDAQGHGHASISLGEGAATSLILAGTGKDEWMTLSDGGLFLTGKGAARVVVTASGSDAPSIEVADTEGYAAEIGVTGIVTPETGKTQKSSAASLVLLGKDRSVLWSAP